jgi:hypothetical protein
MKIKKIIYTILAVLFLFFGYIAISPSDYEVKRGLKIYVPKEFFFPKLTDTEKLSQWFGTDSQFQINNSTDTVVEATEGSGNNKVSHSFTLQPFFVTVIEWKKVGRMSFIQKLKAVFSSPDKVIGAEMEGKLASVRNQTQEAFKNPEGSN